MNLWNKILSTTESALKCGALESIPTEYEFIKDHGMDFFVRIVTNLKKKEQLKKVETGAISKDFNPFLPYDNDLYVADASKTHVCVLNKYNVVDHHLLIITREFEHQDSALNLADFEALWICMREYESLGFYNGGKIGGASQPHKHLQLVPLPLAPRGPKIPIEPLFSEITTTNQIEVSSKVPFPHAFMRFEKEFWKSDEAAEKTLEVYNKMRAELGLLECPAPGKTPAMPFNLLVTRDWIFLLPRKEEHFQSISINSIGYLGGFLVRDEKQMNFIKEKGPMKALIHGAGLFPI